MRFAKGIFFLILGATIACCSGGSGGGPTGLTCSSNATSTPSGSGGGGGANVLNVSISNGAPCSADTYPNKPCVQITLCYPGTTTCQTIDNILLDTGSFGLRIFGSLITLGLNTTVSCTDGGVLAECLQYGDGSSDWGPIAYADVRMGDSAGGEPAITVPIQVIDSQYATPPVQCGPTQSIPDFNPSQAGFNGILGVGDEAQDCGADCADGADTLTYYSCTGNSCVPAKVPLNTQVTNPVALLPTDNNGVSLQLTSGAILSMPNTGLTTASGSLFLGIGTQSNNAPGAVKVFTSTYNTSLGNDTMTTQFSAFSANDILSYIDSGSTDLFIPPPSGLATCSSHAGFFCPPSGQSYIQSYTSTNISATGNVTESTPFSIYNYAQLLASGNSVFNDLASNGGAGNPVFDWGFPFFLGKQVYVGIRGTSSSLGAGPYWAY
jgi:hypothetical protein